MADFILSPTSWTKTLPLDEIFDPPRPLEIDVGCGKGRFLAARAKAHPESNFIGIDRLLVRLRKVNRKLARQELVNVRLLRIEASYAIEHMLPPASVSTFYFFFPDPWPKKKHHKRRLFTETFMRSLKRTLTPKGQVHVATDHLEYFTVIRDLFLADRAFEEIPIFIPDDNVQTEFEEIFVDQDAEIGRCSFQRTSQNP